MCRDLPVAHSLRRSCSALTACPEGHLSLPRRCGSAADELIALTTGGVSAHLPSLKHVTHLVESLVVCGVDGGVQRSELGCRHLRLNRAEDATDLNVADRLEATSEAGWTVHVGPLL